MTKTLEADIEVIKNEISHIREELVGNGKKGIIRKVDELVQFKYYAMGMGAILSILIGWLAMIIH